MSTEVTSRTPLRISLFGGGTDLDWYSRGFGGHVLSIAIDQYVDVVVRPTEYDGITLINRGAVQVYASADALPAGIVRECLAVAGGGRGIEITWSSSVRAGAGLGGSSSFTVGLLNALLRYRGGSASAAWLADRACHVEIDRLSEPIGRQDQYAAAFGGVNWFRFGPGVVVAREPVDIGADFLAAAREQILVVSTGGSRRAGAILADVRAGGAGRFEALHALKQLAVRGREALLAGDLKAVGCLLDESWQQKKQLSERVHNSVVDQIYREALTAGAYGGKLLGAGGHGYFLLICPAQRRAAVRAALAEFDELPFAISASGSRTVAQRNVMPGPPDWRRASR